MSSADNHRCGRVDGLHVCLASHPHAVASPAQLEGQDSGCWCAISGYLVRRGDFVMAHPGPATNICPSASAAAIIKITFLTNYGKYGDFLFDSSDLTIWYVANKLPPFCPYPGLLTNAMFFVGRPSRSVPQLLPPPSPASNPSSSASSPAPPPATAHHPSTTTTATHEPPDPASPAPATPGTEARTKEMSSRCTDRRGRRMRALPRAITPRARRRRASFLTGIGIIRRMGS